MDAWVRRGRGAAAVLLAAALPVGAAAAELAPHRAVYEASLESAQGGAIARGSMVTTVERACDGWITGVQTVIDIVMEGDRPVRQDLRFAGWESFDGTAYRFTSRQRQGETELGFAGSARVGGTGGQADFTAPAKKTVSLPAGALFPVAHTRHLIDRAEAGQRQDVGIVFEGVNGAGPQQFAAFIGARQAPAADAAGRLGPLAARPGWRIHAGYYAPDGRSPAPDYEIDLIQLDNGVVTEVLTTTGPLRIRFRLLKVEAVPPPRC